MSNWRSVKCWRNSNDQIFVKSTLTADQSLVEWPLVNKISSSSIRYFSPAKISKNNASENILAVCTVILTVIILPLRTDLSRRSSARAASLRCLNDANAQPRNGSNYNSNIHNTYVQLTVGLLNSQIMPDLSQKLRVFFFPSARTNADASPSFPFFTPLISFSIQVFTMSCHIIEFSMYFSGTITFNNRFLVKILFSLGELNT